MTLTNLLLAFGLALVLLAVYWKRIRRWYYFNRLEPALRKQWQQLPLHESGALQDVRCTDCPKFSRMPKPRCTVPFGSPLRKCITASVEYHLRDVNGKRVLEVGCGESSHAKFVVEASGGTWVGLDPRAGKHGLDSVRSVGGVVQKMPFRDGSFDVVCGVQTLEHWEEEGSRFAGLGYQSVLAEVWRVLKPGGWLYLDAPIHLHGAAEFIRGDIPAIESIFRRQPWQNLRMMSWRRQHAPLKTRLAPSADRRGWPTSMPDSTELERNQLATQSAWVIAIRAEKPESP